MSTGVQPVPLGEESRSSAGGFGVPVEHADCVKRVLHEVQPTTSSRALSTFDQDYGHDGKALQRVFEFSTVGVSMSDARDLLGIPQPDYIKMDVDGIEHLILRGGAPVLRSARSVLIEINDDFQEHAEEAARLLSAAGLRLHAKRRWEGTDNSPFASTYNQIWYRERTPDALP